MRCPIILVAFQGDFTLDYNQEAQFYGVFSSNHGDLAAAYFPPITAFEGHARSLAVLWASTAQVKCPTKATVYPAHLAPWGAQSFDTTTFGDWNGHFAVLLFINHWEYTRNASFATEVAAIDLGLTSASFSRRPVSDVNNHVPTACALLGSRLFTMLPFDTSSATWPGLSVGVRVSPGDLPASGRPQRLDVLLPPPGEHHRRRLRAARLPTGAARPGAREAGRVRATSLGHSLSSMPPPPPLRDMPLGVPLGGLICTSQLMVCPGHIVRPNPQIALALFRRVARAQLARQPRHPSGTVSHECISSVPRRVIRCSNPWSADWRLQFDVVTNSRVQDIAVATGTTPPVCVDAHSPSGPERPATPVVRPA